MFSYFKNKKLAKINKEKEDCKRLEARERFELEHTFELNERVNVYVDGELLNRGFIVNKRIKPLILNEFCEVIFINYYEVRLDIIGIIREYESKDLEKLGKDNI